MYAQAIPGRRARFTRLAGGYLGAGRIYRIDVGGEIGNLGKKRSLIKKVTRAVRKVRAKVEPKFMTKIRKKVFNKKNFVKFAPVIAGIAQVLNVVPGLGVAVGAAIMAGAAAVAVTAALVAKHEQKKAVKEAEKAEEARATKEAQDEANNAFAVGEQYFGERYGVTKEQFAAMSLEDKLSFLEQAALDKKAEEEKAAGGGDLIMYGLAALALVFALSRKRG